MRNGRRKFTGEAKMAILRRHLVEKMPVSDVCEALASAEPGPYTRTKGRPAPKLGPFKAIVEGILKADEDAPRKQRHTARQVFRRLRDEHGYEGGYDQVRRFVAKRRRNRRETFIPLCQALTRGE